MTGNSRQGETAFTGRLPNSGIGAKLRKSSDLALLLPFDIKHFADDTFQLRVSSRLRFLKGVK